MKNYNLGIYEKSMPNSLSIPEKLSYAKKFGFDFMEISVDETEEKQARVKWSTAERKVITDAIYETGIPIKTMCLSGHRKYPFGTKDPAARDKCLDLMEGAISLAGSLGVRIIQLAGYDEYYNPGDEETRANFLNVITKCTQMAAKEGVMLAFETMETEFMDTVGKAMKYVNLVGSPYLNVYPDSGNLTNAAQKYGHSVKDDILSGAGHIPAMHLKEVVPGAYREIPFSTGIVDFDTCIRTAKECGCYLFNAEFWDVKGVDFKAQALHANQFLREKLDAIFE